MLNFHKFINKALTPSVSSRGAAAKRCASSAFRFFSAVKPDSDIYVKFLEKGKHMGMLFFEGPRFNKVAGTCLEKLKSRVRLIAQSSPEGLLSHRPLDAIQLQGLRKIMPMAI